MKTTYKSDFKFPWSHMYIVTNWDNNPIISKGMYEDFCNRVINIIGFK